MIHDRVELRELRTELALLRRIDSLVVSRRFGEWPVNEDKYDRADREELSDILRSAADPIVCSMIDVVDREFGSVREEIVMSVVQDEAERIVAEAVESGAAPATAASAPTKAPDSPPSSDERGVAGDSRAALPDGDPIATDSTAAQIESAEEATSTLAETMEGGHFHDLADPTANAETTRALGDSEAAPVGDDSAGSVDETDDDAPPAIAEIAESVEAWPVPAAITPSADVIRLAEHAVAEIESGVARLAEALGIGTRFRDAAPRSAPETEPLQTQEDHSALGAIQDEGAEILARIKEFHEETRSARDEADAARREASLFREDARRAKQRSEASAEAAERSADQAAREAQNARMPRGESAECELATTSLP
jgi:hypothetical protein